MRRYLAIPGALLLIAAFIRATINIAVGQHGHRCSRRPAR